MADGRPQHRQQPWLSGGEVVVDPNAPKVGSTKVDFTALDQIPARDRPDSAIIEAGGEGTTPEGQLTNGEAKDTRTPG